VSVNLLLQHSDHIESVPHGIKTQDAGEFFEARPESKTKMLLDHRKPRCYSVGDHLPLLSTDFGGTLGARIHIVTV